MEYMLLCQCQFLAFFIYIQVYLFKNKYYIVIDLVANWKYHSANFIFLSDVKFIVPMFVRESIAAITSISEN